MKLPLSKASLDFHKQAGLATAGEGALLGLILGAIARRIPYLNSLRTTNPAAYDAALGASVVSIEKHLEEKPQEREFLLPGQEARNTTIQPPPWNLM